MWPPYDVSGKVAIITGGAIGIGAAIAEELLDEKAQAVAILDVLEDKGRDTINKLEDKYGKGKALFIKCDVADGEQLSAAYKQVLDAYKRIDIVFNNAGIFQENQHKFKNMININFSGVVEGTLTAIELMRADRGGAGGTVVNIASIAALAKTHICPIYGATKAAIKYFSNSIGMKPTFSRTQVRVLVVCVGVTSTAILEDTIAKSWDEDVGADFARFTAANAQQSPTEAGRGCVEALRRGASGSTWLAQDGTAVDVSGGVPK